MNVVDHSLMENGSFDLIHLLKGREIIRCKLVYTNKYVVYVSVDICKVLLASKVFYEVEDLYSNPFPCSQK
jgi:hypothetical protein